MSEEAVGAELTAKVDEPAPQLERPSSTSRTRLQVVALTVAFYLLGALFVTGRLWVNPGGRWQIGDPQDVDQATWFMRYTATAVKHFHLPALLTSAMNAPHQVNMMWNTSLLLPGVVVSPVTLLFGPQVSLTVLLVIGFAGSATAMFYVLRHWGVSTISAVLGGALYGFSPALINSGIGHYSLVLAMLLPLILDRLLRIVAGDGKPWRNGIWLGVFVAAQLFIAEEALVDTAIAAVVILVLLALSRPGAVRDRLVPSLIGLGTGAVVALVLAARGLWVQFHGVPVRGASATVIIQYNGHMTNLGSLPYSFVTPARSVLLHTAGSAAAIDRYPQPSPEYLAYLGVPLIILLIVAVIRFWHDLTIRTAGITCLVLEWMSLGAKPLVPGTVQLPGFLLPWQYLQHLPLLGGMVPDRLCILADAAAAVVLAFALDKARTTALPFAGWRDGAMIATGVAVIALLPLVPAPYRAAPVAPVPAGWYRTFNTLHLPRQARVLLAPYPYAGTSEMLRWQAASGEPESMIGGDFIAPGVPGRKSRAGRSGLTDFGIYVNLLYKAPHSQAAVTDRPSNAQIRADLAKMKPDAVVADATAQSVLGQFLIEVFGRPTTQIGHMMGWKLHSTP